MKTIKSISFAAVLFLIAIAVNVFSQTEEYGVLRKNGYLPLQPGQWASAPNVTNQNTNGTLEMWIYVNSVNPSGSTLVTKGAAADKSFGWYINGSSQFVFRMGNTEVVNSGAPISSGNWHHAAVTWEGGGPYTVKFYLDGAQTGSQHINNGTWNMNNDSLKVGKDDFFADRTFNGYVDELRYWSTARTEAQIRNNRFIGFGDAKGVNDLNSLSSSSNYFGIVNAWTFNTNDTFIKEWIGGITMKYRSMSAVFTSLPGLPIPVNFALKLEGGANDYVAVPHRADYFNNLNNHGAIDAWVYSTPGNPVQAIVTKGSGGNTQFCMFLKNNKLTFGIGNDGPIESTVNVPANKWTHVAAVWKYVGPGSINYSVRLYINGKLVKEGNNGEAMPNSNEPLRIGNYQGVPNYNFTGFLDEVRVWSVELSQQQIESYKFNSCRADNMPGMLSAWNFDGGLYNLGFLRIVNDGTFNTGGINNARLSGFANDTIAGTPGPNFIAHTTVLSRLSLENPFPDGFYLNISNRSIPDNSIVRDTISISGSGNLESIEVFLSVTHSNVEDLDIILRAPNGEIRQLTTDNGTNGDDILTFFVDGETPVTNPQYLAPWSDLTAPENTMGTFGGTKISGNWILEVTDDNTGNTGVLEGWGIRINDAVTIGIEPISNTTPGKYSLSQNYPNPFNPESSIEFAIAKTGFVKLSVFDITGREVESLVNEEMNAGTFKVKWNASKYSSGVYFYRIESGSFTDTKKMMLVK